MPLTYLPSFRVHGATQWTPHPGGQTTSTSVIFSGLSSSTQYDFQIEATNAFGTTPSVPVSATTLSSVTITGVSLSNQSFIAGQPAGTPVGTISVTMSSGSFTGSLSVTGTDAGSFKIVSSQLQLNVGTTTARTYNINIVATMATVPTVTQNFPNITATPAIAESGEGFVVQGTDTTTIMYASQTRGVAQPSGPYLQFSMIPTNGNSVNLLAPGQSLITTNSGSVSRIVYGKNTCFQTNTSGGWWYWDTSKTFGPGNWNEFGVSSITLSSSTYPVGATNNTPIGNITIAMITSTDTFSGILTVSDPTNSFKIVSGQLQATKALSGNYTPTITATPYTTTDASAQVIGEVLSIAPTLTVASVTGTAPTIASDAGFSTKVFEDDFISSSTVANTQFASTGFKWYWGLRMPGPHQVPNPQNECSFLTTSSAASIVNGNSGGGSNASSAGGILRINTGWFPNNNIITVPGWAMNNGAAGPALGTGRWRRGYFEAYIQYRPDQNNPSYPLYNDDTTGWPAFWSWAYEGISDFGFPGAGLTTPNTMELDFLEQFGFVSWDTSGTNRSIPGVWTSGAINHGGSGSAGISNRTADANWHTYGFLWTTGHVAMYLDNNPTPIGQLTLSGGATALDNQSLFIVLGTGPNWAMHIDWVRVWQ